MTGQRGIAVRRKRWLAKLLMQDIRRSAVSWLLALVALTLAVAYSIPGMGVSRNLPSGRRSVVAFLDPAWSFVFGALALALMGSLAARAWLVASHTLGVAASSFWSAALLIGAVMSEPAGPITTAVLAILMTVLHFWSVVDYAGG